MVGNELFVSSHPRKVDGETRMNKKIITIAIPRSFSDKIDEAWGKLGYRTRTEWYAEKGREVIKEAAEKSRNFVEAVEEDTTE